MTTLRRALYGRHKSRLRIGLSLALPYLVVGLALSATLLPMPADIEATLRVDSFAYEVGAGGRHDLARGQSLLRIGAFNHADIDLGDGILEPTASPVALQTRSDERVDAPWTISPGAAADTLWLGDAGGETTSISLNRLDVSEGARVSVSLAVGPVAQVVIDVDDPTAIARIGLKDRAMVHCSYCLAAPDGTEPTLLGEAVLSSDLPQVVSIPAGAAGLTLVLEFPGDRELVDVPIPVASELQFSDILRGTPVSSVSGGGRVVLTELSRTIEVQPRQLVALGDLGQVSIISLVATASNMEVTLAGRVGTLCTGYPPACVSRLPSVLEWLHAREKWLLYLSGVGLLGGLLVGTLARIRQASRAADEE